ncbi:hypothetical protein [uncultured Flavobacterium sp.]|uniref:hypothetical protein n=1 Tax=uncultured Flavobacterium sp. TaxID=165435 RepID=UPI0025CBFA3C|nr:hypothetical protein [uncultured Flavobacterium sp.]
MKKILFAIAIVTFACTFVSCDADSVDDGLSTMNADDSGGSGGVIPPPPPPPKDPITGG